jgi:hypothetical protein
MSELMEIDPRLVAVRDKESGRNLLDPSDPNPLTIDTSEGRPVRFELIVENGPEGLMELTITSDEPWLKSEKNKLTLVGGEKDRCILTAAPEGESEFAILLFTWQGAKGPLSASVMLMRKMQTARPAVTPRPKQQSGTYTAEISRENPTCFLFLVDESGSMRESISGQVDRSKADSLSDALNRLLHELVSSCSQGMEIVDRFHIGIIRYGDESVESALGGALAGKKLVPVSMIGNNPLRVETRTKKQYDGVGGIIEAKVKVPVWYEPVAKGKTPMCAALNLACDFVKEFIQSHPACFPPVVINITDGKPNDGDPRPMANALREITSEDGKVLLFNVHISSSNAEPIQYPVKESVLSDNLARLLFRMSSQIPPPMLKLARAIVPNITEGARGFVFNADMVATIQMLDIGTRGVR